MSLLQEFSCDLGSGRSGLCCPEVAASEARHLLTARRGEAAQAGLQLPEGVTDQDIKQRLDSRQTCGRCVTRLQTLYAHMEAAILSMIQYLKPAIY